MLQISTLDNGIRLLTERIPHVHSVSVGFWVDSGSRHERAEQNGLSHFVEHMLFKGTARRSSQDISLAIDMVGGILNAFTGREYTCYYAKVMGDKIAEATELLADVFQNSLYAPDEIEKERRVILQEIGMIEDTPDDSIHDMLSMSLWKGHPVGAPIIGTRDSIQHLTRDDVCRFVQERYCGKRLIIAAAGDVDHDRFVELVDEQLNQLLPGEAQEELTSPKAAPGDTITCRPLEQAHFCLGVPALPHAHPDRFGLYLLNLILGGSMSSRLFQEVREKRGLSYSVYSYLNNHVDCGSLAVYAGADATAVPVVLGVIRNQFEKLAHQPVSGKELKAAKEQLKGNLLLSLESSDNRMCRLAKNEILLGRQISMDEILKEIDQVSVELVARLSEKLLNPGKVNLQVLGPVEGLQDEISGIFGNG